MLSRATENAGLMWNPPPRPDTSRLDEWFLGGVALVFSAPLRCHSFRKCMRSLQDHGRHLLLPEINLVAPPPSPPSMVEPLWGTRASPLWSGLWPCNCVQQSLPLCGVNRVSPHGPVSIRQASLAVLIEPVGRRLLPYTPWRYCRSIRPKHWETCTRVGMTWRFYRSCVLRRTSRSERQRWPHSLWVVRCPRLWSRSAISGCVSLTWRSRRRYSSWMLPCHRPDSSATLSRAVPSSFRQHRSRLRRSNTSCAGGNPLLLPLRLQPLSLLVTVGAPLWPPPLPRRGSSLPPCGVVEPVTGRTPSPSRPPPNLAASTSARGPETGDPEMEGNARREMVTAPLPPPEEARVENPLFRFVFVLVPKTSIKEQFPQSLGLKRRRVVYRASRDHFPPPLSPGRWGLPKSTSPAHLWNRVGAVALKPPLQVVTRKPGSCVSPHTRRNQVSVTLHTQIPPPAITGQAVTGPGPGPCVPHRCPTTGTSVTPLVPLARSLGAWLALPSPSRWLLRTIRLGYAIQFAQHSPKFRGIRFTSVKPADAPVLRAEIAVLLAKDAIEPVPPADMESGLFSPYFIVPKKGGGLRPILDLRVLNRALHKLPFKMLTQKRIFGCVRPLDWFPAIDLKDAYFHVSILPRHRSFLRFALEGRAYQYKVLPLGLSLSPRVFTKVVETFVPLREQGVRILNCLHDWLILAQSRRQLSAHRDLVLKHLSLLGLRLNWEKSKLVPMQRISFLGMEFDSVNQTARLTQECAQSVLNCFKTLSGRTAVPLKLFQRLLGHMAAAAVTVPLGLLHMRLLQHWLYGRIPRWAWKRGTYRVQITPACRKTFRPWSDPSFLQAGVPLKQVSRHAVVFTDASTTGWGATYNGHAVSGVWTGPQLHWQINCLELLAVRLALSHLRGCLQRKDVLVRTDNNATVAYINRQGGLRSRRMSQLARHLLLWSQKHLRSLRAIHIPGVFNWAANELSRAALPGEWRLHPQAVQLIWGRFGAAQVDLFASPETTHCQEFYSLTEATLGTDALAHSWPWGLRKYAFPPVSLLAQTLCKIREDEEQVLLVVSYWPNRTWFPELMLLATAPPWPIPLRKDMLSQRRGTLWHPEVLADLPQEVALTIASARAPFTRRAYTLKWNLFVEWCSSHQEDPRRCSIRAVLSFLQQGLERRLSPSTLKVYVAAISAHHDPVEGKSVGKHNLVVRFLRGARRLNPPRPSSLPSWDLALVLRALITAPFEPLQSVELKFLSMKTLLLTALASIKRVGDLQAFSVDDSCLEFGPADSSATLRPRPGYVPKVPTTPFWDQVVNLQSLPLEEADPTLALLCPVRALRQYTDRTQSFRTSEQLFVCYGGQQKGKAVSKQRMAHWIVDAITLAYEAQGVPCPLRLRAHSTRGVASSWALARGASLADICRAAGWATPNTFARFYSLRVEPVSSCVLTSNG